MNSQPLGDLRPSEPATFAPSVDGAKSGGEASAADVVRAIYGQILKRPADRAGLENYTAALENGTATVKSIVSDFLQSDEWRIRFIDGRSSEQVFIALYGCALSRAPDVAGWNHLIAWEPRAGWKPIIDGFIDGPEYAQRVGDNTVPGSQLTFASRMNIQAVTSADSEPPPDGASASVNVDE